MTRGDALVRRGQFASLPWALAAIFFGISTAVSYARWANFEYRTFDLAYYVQAAWQLLHGRSAVSILDVPLLGNHVEPIVFLFVPFFAVFRHPIVFVALQNVALALMCPVGYDIARRLGFAKTHALCLAAALLLAPVTGFVALHEFHPEALTAPFLLLLLRARMRDSVAGHWLWFCAVLACKENMAFLLVAYCTVGAFVEWARGFRHVRLFYLWPLLAAAVWFVLCAKVITPALNSGNIDYLALYNALGSSPGEILRHAVTEPSRMLAVLSASLRHGNLITGTLLPFLLLPLLRPRWLLVAAPILLQHLLSWRPSEWTIYFHYAAPLIPIFWFASIEALTRLRYWRSSFPVPSYAAPLMVVACLAGQWMLGPAGEISRAAESWRANASVRSEKNRLLARIPPAASIIAPLPYLSHLAQRGHCYSLHFMLKGLKTLSHVRYEPPPLPEFVLIDYLDTATFDPKAGYYHPKMNTMAGAVMPSSDELLHTFLARSAWRAEATNEFVLLSRAEQREAPAADAPPENAALAIGGGARLLAIRRSSDRIASGEPITIVMDWSLDARREIHPWLELVFICDASSERTVATKGLCAPEIREGVHRETWRITRTENLTCGSYHLEARFLDNPRRTWANQNGSGTTTDVVLAPIIPLGPFTIVNAATRGSGR